MGLISSPTHVPRCAPTSLPTHLIAGPLLSSALSPCPSQTDTDALHRGLLPPGSAPCPPRPHGSATLHFLQEWAFLLFCPLPPHSPSFQILGAETGGSDGLLRFPRPGVTSLPRQRPHLGPGVQHCRWHQPGLLILEGPASAPSLPRFPTWRTQQSPPGTFLCLDLIPQVISSNCFSQPTHAPLWATVKSTPAPVLVASGGWLAISDFPWGGILPSRFTLSV